MSKLYPPQKLVSPRRGQAVRGWRKPSEEEKVEQPVPISPPISDVTPMEFKNLPINEAIELLGRWGGLEDKLYYLKSQGFDSFEIEGTGDFIGGVIVKSAKTSEYFDNTFERRFKRFEEDFKRLQYLSFSQRRDSCPHLCYNTVRTFIFKLFLS